MTSYRVALSKSPYLPYVASGLREHIDGPELADASIEYKLPHIHTHIPKYKKKERFITKPTDVRLPARLSSPLIPYPLEIQELSCGWYTGPIDKIHGHHYSQLLSLTSVFEECVSAKKIPEGELKFDMDSLKKFGRQKYSSREDLINLATIAFARRATKHDLSISADTTVPFEVGKSRSSNYTSFIIMIQRLRVHIGKESTFPTFSADQVSASPEDATYTMFSNGVYLYQSTNTEHGFCILSCGGHFRIYHRSLKYWFCGPSSYLDYLFTVADILNNLDVLKNCEEYSWATDMFDLMIQFSEHEGFHREQVDFMKTLEGFLLNMSDYDECYAMNWKPILEAVESLWSLDKTISGVVYDFGLPIALLRDPNMMYPESSFLCRFISAGKKLSRTHLQEISALHKLIFYAEVNAKAGVEKFLKRVHTKRPMEANAVKNITRLAKSQFFLSYRKKHKLIPRLLGPPEKVKLLETYSSASSTAKIELLPLSWWDDVKIFDCMDNTMTDDPLEFAKDKGALKDHISFGPGDSRKELLQVIEREDYALTDFFKRPRIQPRPQFVQITTQKEQACPMRDPARLIEKEREQKWEARLFANGELSNKHSLSLIAARMKKALSYFDEQLMTPTDRKRKSLIHEASRELLQKDNYSLLLDIEGHNQSMQYENTHELAEFLGNLFGFDGWGDLSHYFGQLTVYHYDEYLDDVMESHGQYGGIEGWLNPFWTLHTTLMMKLLRIMTDVEVKTIMVYSDDVDAIVNIKQASEPMVQSVFSKIMKHCSKFGMTVKYSQTTLSKHRITMLRQHYADGIRADSTLKRLISISAGNNATLVSDELEVAGICSSASSAMELSNHHEACSYLKNYKLGLLLCRMPQMILSKVSEDSMISPKELPTALSNLIYYSKADSDCLDLMQDKRLYMAAKNDIASYLGRNVKHMRDDVFKTALQGVYGVGVAESRLVDSPDRILYLQIYDDFIQDLLFFWLYLPTTLGGLGASLHLNLMLSGHSIGMSKSLHYLHRWTHRFSSNAEYFLRYLSTTLSITDMDQRNFDEERVVASAWPSDQRICPATTSVQQSIKSMVRRHAKNKKVREMFELSDDRTLLAQELVNIFRKNFHSRIVQFYHENTSIHFIDLLISKIETSSGLLTRVRNITRLRNSMCSRAIENIRLGAYTGRTYFVELSKDSDIIECLLHRKISMFPKISFIEVEEVLYDDKIREVDRAEAMITVRRCAPTHYRNGIKVYDDPKVGNETLYKGELLDNDRMLGNKEELLAAKLVAVTKWFLMKYNLLTVPSATLETLDVFKACNLSLSTLTKQTFGELFHFAPTETGGEILHRIPNIRFSTATYIRSEMNRSLHYTTELNQRIISDMGLVDSNVNFDYLRMRLLIVAIVIDKYDTLRRLVSRYGFSNLKGIKDVQFVKPCPTNWTVSKTFRCYSDIRQHSLSVNRFRYLSYSYLHEENINEWAIMPKESEICTAEQVGHNYINDIILRYSRDLDKDYMLISPETIEIGVWKPLLMKLYRINEYWKSDNTRTDEEEIAHRLTEVMEQRGRMTTVDHTNKLLLSLQSQCLTMVDEQSPGDIEFQLLVKKYSAITQSRRHSARLNIRLSQYQTLLNTYETHRRNLAISLLQEYILTFHFKVMKSGTELVVDVDAALEEFLASGLAQLSYIVINPELQVRMMILGYEYIDSVIHKHYELLKTALFDCCSDASCSDILVPETLPSMESWTSLTGKEDLPKDLEEIEYVMEPISLSAMSSIEQAKPLFEYASTCCNIGANPRVFTSHTGSDSLGAQYSLFRMLMHEKLLDKDMRLCDLTAGRGDGLYAAQYNGLSATSFSREDTFTRLNHHPGINFKKEYDIFNGATLKFVTDFDFVHVDISFTGPTESNILDLVMFLEEHNLPYSIRLNSVNLMCYNETTTSHLPAYSHSIAYSVNSQMKSYQIYLIGTPGASSKIWKGPEFRETLAFRSLTLSYSRLLSPGLRANRLHSYAPNSASIYLPRGMKGDEFIQKVCTDSIEEEQLHYLRRYAAEVGSDAKLEFMYESLTDEGRQLLDRYRHLFVRVSRCSYNNLSFDQIGNVSQKSQRYHEMHVTALMNPPTQIFSCRILNCDEAVLNYFRTHHPLQEIRTWCNVILGLHTFCRASILSGHDALLHRYQELINRAPTKNSLHQRELFLAVKLMVLAARDDNYTYGVNYCHRMINSGRRSSTSMKRTLKMYRLISYLFTEIQRLMWRGLICIRSIDAISNELEVRERTRYRYKRLTEDAPSPTLDTLTLDHIISGSIDQLFQGLENYASDLIEKEHPSHEGDQMTTILGNASLLFDMDIGNHVDSAIARLGLVPTGPRNIIDLGDDDILEYDEW